MKPSNATIGIENLWSQYDGEPILCGLSLTLEPGGLYGLVGENGSGKTTFGRVLQGLLRPNKGTIWGLGRSPRKKLHGSVNRQVQGVPQHPKTFPGLSVGDYYRLVSGKVPKDKETHTPLSSLSMSGLNLLGIRAAIHAGPKLLFLDETTAPMGPEEVKLHYATVRNFTDQGGIALVVSHRLQELIDFSDGIFVIRHGSLAGFFPPGSNAVNISHSMFGKSNSDAVLSPRAVKNRIHQEPILRVSNLSLGTKKVSFDLFPGEIHCILGMKEQGLELLEDSLAGLDTNGRDHIHPPLWKKNSGFSYVPRDRYGRGLFPGLSVRENFQVHGTPKNPPSLPSHWLHQPIQNLSGGMAQRLILDREIPRAEHGLLVCEPGIGLDQTHRAYLHQALIDLRNEGKGVLVLTSDPDEALSLGDRISVVHDNEIVAQSQPFEGSREFLSDLMVGLSNTLSSSETGT